MSLINCSSCEDLRKDAPHFMANGLTKTECNSLKNNTGLSTTNDNDSCTDLDNMNDCLVGNMAAEIESYQVCDWKKFTKSLVNNVWTVLKGITCTICGLWKTTENLQCQIDYLFQGDSFDFSEYSQTDKSYIVAGKGVSFLNVSQSGTAADIKLVYVAGGLARLTGSCLFYDEDFHEDANVWNFDEDGRNPTKSSGGSRLGNSEWSAQNTKPSGGSALVYEIRLYKPEFPQIDQIFPGFGLNSQGGGYHVTVDRFTAGTYAHGQRGHCDRTNGDPVGSGSSRGHLVKDDYIYIQVRITWIESMSGDGSQYTPDGLFGIRMKQSAIKCD